MPDTNTNYRKPNAILIHSTMPPTLADAADDEDEPDATADDEEGKQTGRQANSNQAGRQAGTNKAEQA